MKTVTVRQAKTKLSRLIERACEGEDIVINRGKQPLVRLVPIAASKGSRKPGALRGKLHVGKKFFEPLPPEELELWR